MNNRIWIGLGSLIVSGVCISLLIRPSKKSDLKGRVTSKRKSEYALSDFGLRQAPRLGKMRLPVQRFLKAALMSKGQKEVISSYNDSPEKIRKRIALFDNKAGIRDLERQVINCLLDVRTTKSHGCPDNILDRARELYTNALAGNPIANAPWTVAHVKNEETFKNERLSRLVAASIPYWLDHMTDDPKYRAKDRLAQREPVWAIHACPEDYETGKDLAKVMRPVVNFLKEKQQKGKTLFVHGRDGEIIHEILRRAGVRSFYGITSRTITSDKSKWLDRKLRENVKEYLGKVCPKKAVHVDTGFMGSVANWMKKKGFAVEEIWLVSADPSKLPYQIPGADCVSFMESLIEGSMENVDQRLETPSEMLFGKNKVLPFRYGSRPECFWSRVYGLTDGLGLPRKVHK